MCDVTANESSDGNVWNETNDAAHRTLPLPVRAVNKLKTH